MWCTTRQVWKDKTQGNECFEITICAECLNRDVLDTCSTLLHEMAQLYLQNGIKATSRGFSYHNKRFKEAAETCGLSISYDKRIGWSLTGLTSEAKQYIESIYIDKDCFNISRRLPMMILSPQTGENSQPLKPKQSFRKYVCRCCGLVARTTKEANLMCGDCDTSLEKA